MLYQIRRGLITGRGALDANAVLGTSWDTSLKGPNVVLSNGNLTVGLAPSTTTFNVALSTTSYSTGKKYHEITANTQSFPAFSGFGIATPSVSLTSHLWSTSEGLAAPGNGEVYCNATDIGDFAGMGAPGQVMGIAVDFDAQKIWFWLNDLSDRWNNIASDAVEDPITGTGGISIAPLTGTGPYHAAIHLYSAADHVFTANFGATAYSNPNAAALASAGFGDW